LENMEPKERVKPAIRTHAFPAHTYGNAACALIN
jgi:hypothetical protein